MSENESIEERRGSERQDGQFPCQVVINEVAYEGVTRNLSLGGVLFTPDGDFPDSLVDEKGMVTVVIGELPYDALCEVVRVAKSGVGLRFVDLSQSALEDAIFDFISGQLDEL